MVQTTQKIIGIGSSDGITLPAKELAKNGLKRGDLVEVYIRPVQERGSKTDQEVIDAAKKILADYKQDFQNLANR